MHEQVAEAFFLVKGTLKYKWLAIAVAWVLCLAGWFYIMTMPNQYISEAKVQVNSRTMLRPLLRGLTIETDTRSLLVIMKKLMVTNINLEKIAHLAKLKGITQGKEQRLKLLTLLKKKISIGGGDNDIFNVTYTSSDPNVAKNVVLAVLALFSKQSQEKTKGDIGSAQRFLNNQIQEYEERLVQAEQSRENFKRENFGLLPENERDQMAQLNALNMKLDEAKLSLNEVTSRKKMLQVQLGEALDSNDEWTVSNLSQEAGGGGLSWKIQELKSNRTDLLLKFTENHPAIVSINTTIEILEQRRKEQGPGSVDARAMVNPYVQSLKEAANGASAEVAAIQSRVNYLQAQLDKRTEQLDSRLKIETAMKNLNRDYDTIKENYMKLLQRREQATMSGKLDLQAASLQFRVADPPNLPLKPDSPNRMLLNPAVLVLGLLGGFGTAFLIYFIRPVYMSVKELRVNTGLPVLGTVSMLALNEDSSGHFSVNSFLMAAIGLLAVFMIIMMIEVLAAGNETIYQYVQDIYWQLNILVGG